MTLAEFDKFIISSRLSLTCLRVDIQEVLLSAGHGLQDHLEVLDVVGQGALLQDVPSLHKHLLEVEEKLKQFLGSPRNEITEARYCTKFPTDFLNLQLALVNDLLQRHVTMRDLAQAENVTKVTNPEIISPEIISPEILFPEILS